MAQETVAIQHSKASPPINLLAQGATDGRGIERKQTMRGTEFARLTAFVAVAEHSSFTRAARHIGVSTPALSESIRALEESFGIRLLNRTTRSVAVTEAGQQLFDHLRPILEGVDSARDAVNDLRDKPAGTLRLSVHPVAAAKWLSPVVALFSAEYPAIALEVTIESNQRDIVGEHYDAGIHVVGDVTQDMIAVPIGAGLPSRAVASPRYLSAHGAPSEPEDLRLHNCIQYRWTSRASSRPWTFLNANRQVEVAVHGSLIVNDLDLALRGALGGIGIAKLPEDWIAPLLSDGRLTPLLPEWRSRCTSFCLFYSSRRHVPLKLRKLIDFLRNQSRIQTGSFCDDLAMPASG